VEAAAPAPARARGASGRVNEARLAAERLLAAQPSSVHGTPDLLVERGTDALLAVTEQLAEAIVRAVHGKSSARAIKSAIEGAARRFGSRKLAMPIRRELLHGAMLGALDSAWEAAEDEAIAIERFTDLHPARRALAADTGFTKKPMADAIAAFLKKKAVTRETFDRMEASAQRKAFTVAGAASEEMVQAVKRELARQVEAGADLKDFGRHAAKRFEQAGWVPANGSHVETVFRTNVIGAYSQGRVRQMTEPEALKLRPFWQWLTCNDPPRVRPNHFAMHGVVLRATDPLWLEAYPPAGYNCRCRVRSLSLHEGAGKVQEGKNFRRYVPDDGFTSGLPALLPSEGLPDLEPANDTELGPANDT
jgi:SPP1 gp7 family putative phage head morphogenesis protein